MSTESDKEVRLSVPADAEYLDTIRLSLYGVAVRMGFSYESIEDLKVAVTEACNHALMQLEDGAEVRLLIAYAMNDKALRVRVGAEQGALKFSRAIEDAAPIEDGGLGGADASQLGLFLMQALVDEVNVVPADNGEEEIVLIKYREAQAG
ncbi:ATP-binding protein [Paenibacillus allorhizosphaerae]|uniref:Serine-protein kinase RsbW n=1 Tax=Paenibacillus allorhizosphaerae TaxID=2849866 RepID=A0ABM8VJK9_9BACL|nr:ATP-binding protein [Paenibacillus allorhizosphaerae]CAG7645666.1 Serine-protein kinase RsbW [Paenibacillus allorhizosphaerae]